MTEIADLKVGDEVILTIKAKVVMQKNANVEGCVYFDYAQHADYIEVENGHLESGAVTIERVTPPLPTAVGVYVPASNSDFPEDSWIYKLKNSGWWYSDGRNDVSGQEALDQALYAHEKLGGLVRLVPEQ